MNPILILVLLVAVLLTVSLLRRRPHLLRHPVVRSAAIGIVTLGLMYLSTRFHWSFLLFGLAPLLPRLMVALNRAKAARGPTPGSTSRVETGRLRMTIDHDSGALSGEVLGGAYRGRTLDSLSEAELLALLSECRREDPESARLLEAYLDRRVGAGWRAGDESGDPAGGTQGAGGGDGGGTGTGTGGVPMTAAQALEILGLGPDATREAIVSAHRRLIQKLHPDRGGSGYLAAQINRAKDVLLG